MKWIYKNNTDNTCRYVLGILGDNPLICFGINPSTAEPKALELILLILLIELQKVMDLIVGLC